MKHNVQIKKALGIEGVHTETSVWRYKAQKGEPATQIDLLIDRQDMCINICEMKYTISPFEITKEYASELENKLNIFRDATKTRKTLFLTMVTTHGIKKPNNFTGLVQSEVSMSALFQ